MNDEFNYNFNWCNTKYIFHGNEEDIKKLALLINSSFAIGDSRDTLNGEYDWLGNILITAGLRDYIAKSPNEYFPENSPMADCSGFLSEVGVPQQTSMDWILQVTTNTINLPLPRMWDFIIIQLDLKSVSYSFMSANPKQRFTQIYECSAHPEGDFQDYNISIMYNFDPESDDKQNIDKFNDMIPFSGRSNIFTTVSFSEGLKWLNRMAGKEEMEFSFENLCNSIRDVFVLENYCKNITSPNSFMDLWFVSHVYNYWRKNSIINGVTSYNF